MTSAVGTTITGRAFARNAEAGRLAPAAGLDARARRLRAALGFLRLPPTEPEVQLLHRWLDTWTGVELITAASSASGRATG